jgi:hypothetical protein
MDDNHNNNTNTPPTPSTTNEDKNNDGYGQKAPKWGRQSSRKSARIAEKMLLSPPKKKPPIKVNKGMEVSELGLKLIKLEKLSNVNAMV